MLASTLFPLLLTLSVLRALSARMFPPMFEHQIQNAQHHLLKYKPWKVESDGTLVTKEDALEEFKGREYK